MIREIFAPRGLMMFFILWMVVTAGFVFWRSASKEDKKTWLHSSLMPITSAILAFVVMLGVVFVANLNN